MKENRLDIIKTLYIESFQYIYSNYQSSVYFSPFAIPITKPYDLYEEYHSWFKYFQSLGLDSINITNIFKKVMKNYMIITHSYTHTHIIINEHLHFNDYVIIKQILKHILENMNYYFLLIHNEHHDYIE